MVVTHMDLMALGHQMLATHMNLIALFRTGPVDQMVATHMDLMALGRKGPVDQMVATHMDLMALGRTALSQQGDQPLEVIRQNQLYVASHDQAETTGPKMIAPAPGLKHPPPLARPASAPTDHPARAPGRTGGRARRIWREF